MSDTEKTKKAIARRFKRIEGQVNGLSRMLDGDRYCMDILHQIQAAKAALTKAETELLRLHARKCVDEALEDGSIEDQRKKIIELVDLFERVR